MNISDTTLTSDKEITLTTEIRALDKQNEGDDGKCYKN